LKKKQLSQFQSRLENRKKVDTRRKTCFFRLQMDEWAAAAAEATPATPAMP